LSSSLSSTSSSFIHHYNIEAGPIRCASELFLATNHNAREVKLAIRLAKVKERDRRQAKQHVKYNGVVKELKAVKSFHFIHHSSQEIELLYQRNIFEGKLMTFYCWQA